jgi:aldehyde dehydrogenase (NAD+)
MSDSSSTPSGVVTEVAEVDGAVQQLRDSFMSGKTQPLKWRRQQLQAVKAMMLENKERIVRSVMDDLGKQLPMEVLASEFNIPLTELDETLHKLSQWACPEDVYTPIGAQPASSHIYQQVRCCVSSVVVVVVFECALCPHQVGRWFVCAYTCVCVHVCVCVCV